MRTTLSTVSGIYRTSVVDRVDPTAGRIGAVRHASQHEFFIPVYIGYEILKVLVALAVAGRNKAVCSQRRQRPPKSARDRREPVLSGGGIRDGGASGDKAPSLRHHSRLEQVMSPPGCSSGR